MFNISFLLLKEIDNPAAKEYIQLKKYLGIPALTEELDKFLKIMGSLNSTPCAKPARATHWHTHIKNNTLKFITKFYN